MRLAIFTHDAALFQLIESCFEAEGAVCTRYSAEVELARALHREEFSAIVFDAAAGFDPSHPVLARRACYGDRRAPLIAIGDFCARDRVLAALEAGADDIVLLPVDPRELRLRFHLAVRRFASHPAAVGGCLQAADEIETGVYHLHRADGTAYVNGAPIKLTAREFAIAWVLFSQQGNYVTRRSIAATVWGSSEEIVGRTLEQHIYKLRKKLLLDGAHGIVLRTMYAHGYRIEQRNEQRGEQRIEPRNEQRIEPPVERVVQRDASPARRAAANDKIKVHAGNSATARSAQPWSPEPDNWAFLTQNTGTRRLA
ncbi:response regulator transcription factor [Paraburkholderia sp. BCC1886]|uniref:response regulator transcription factor n=1 Tax=Paraburkholderia sp. BCC1886 TaxID=2562670 RepID=UPI0021B258F9|nr:response regulator transcription factor [Paraburkholderia sp. BCC1886]